MKGEKEEYWEEKMDANWQKRLNEVKSGTSLKRYFPFLSVITTIRYRVHAVAVYPEVLAKLTA
jgi:hypothetical protein